MRKVILSMMVSLDGKTARPDGNLDWFLSDREFEDEMLSLLRSVDGMLFGRKSYELTTGRRQPSPGRPTLRAASPARSGGASSRGS